jgi:hypothetical protein
MRADRETGLAAPTDVEKPRLPRFSAISSFLRTPEANLILLRLDQSSWIASPSAVGKRFPRSRDDGSRKHAAFDCRFHGEASDSFECAG